MKRIYTIVILIFFASIALGQSTNISTIFQSPEDKGDQMFEDLYFEQAIDYYNTALRKKPGDSNLTLKVAECYRQLRDYDNAEHWYRKALQISSLPDIGKYYFAETLTANGKYSEAAGWYDKYMQEAPGDTRPVRKMEGISNKRYFFRDSTLIELTRININSEEADFGAAAYDQGIIFLSSRNRELFIDNDFLREESLLDMYYSEKNSNGKYTPPVPFSKIVNTKYHEGPAAFSTDGRLIIFSRSNYLNGKRIIGADGKTKVQLFIADRKGNAWKDVRPFQYNNINYNIGHPAFSLTNDTLFFSSDMPGGYGGSDLYACVKSGDGWSPPVNLGEVINTEGDEMYPQLISNRLFFSSNGFGGLGGMDIYKAVYENNAWGGVANLGYPINSSFDEINYQIDPQSHMGYISSNRKGGEGKEDIYAFTQLGLVLNGVAMQMYEEDLPVTEAVITLLDQDGKEISTVLTDDNGYFHFYIPFDEDFTISASKKGYTLLAPLKVSSRGSLVDMDTVDLFLWKNELFSKGKVYSNETQALLPGVTVIMEDLSTGKADSLITSEDGEYSFLLFPERRYRVTAKKENYLPSAFNLSTANLRRGDLVNDIILETEFLEKVVIFFDFDKYDLKTEGIPDLQRMVDYLKSHPETGLNIGAHADCRGTREYNQDLSNNRAKTTLEYFTSHGISIKRITWQGFGEALLTNRCSDGVECTEPEHAKNRRAELKIN